jgi:hypothetical protein
MNQRVLDGGTQFIPRPSRGGTAAPVPTTGPEELVFDKADEAETIEVMTTKRDELVQLVEAMKKELSSAPDEQKKSELAAEIARLEQRASRLEIAIKARRERSNEAS